mmetsp:Transcript_24585/g.47873  ORF Transcript_24585/g.47873 Transcript_24585/m.47873 type:complete len:207 (+) Transcript_24585:523-1143(+)
MPWISNTSKLLGHWKKTLHHCLEPRGVPGWNSGVLWTNYGSQCTWALMAMKQNEQQRWLSHLLVQTPNGVVQRHLAAIACLFCETRLVLSSQQCAVCHLRSLRKGLSVHGKSALLCGRRLHALMGQRFSMMLQARCQPMQSHALGRCSRFYSTCWNPERCAQPQPYVLRNTYKSAMSPTRISARAVGMGPFAYCCKSVHWRTVPEH